MGSRYLFIVLYVFLEHHLSRGDYRRGDYREASARGRLKRERAGSRLAQRKMRAAEGHQRAEAQRRETCEHA